MSAFIYNSTLFTFSLAAEFERIQTAKDVLTDDEKRQNYDKWRHSGISIPFSKWCNMRGAVHTVRKEIDSQF